MERRTDAAELLDGTLDDQSALVGNLRDLGRVNRRLGGATLSAMAIEALAAHRDDLTLLDIGTGGGDIPLVVGGTIPQSDVPKLEAAGAVAVYPTGTPLESLVASMKELIAAP